MSARTAFKRGRQPGTTDLGKPGRPRMEKLGQEGDLPLARVWGPFEALPKEEEIIGIDDRRLSLS